MLRRLFGQPAPAASPVPKGREFKAGDVVEQRYVIEAVRRGYMGIVYIATDKHRRTKVVLKTFQNKFLWDDDAVNRFSAEAELWMRLGSHPNIVRAYDIRTLLGKPHVVAEYVHGGALRSLIGHLSLQEALDYAIQICWGMDHAASRLALVHCDLKPDNIMVTLDGHAKVTDFGLARVMPQWQWTAEQHDRKAMLPRRRAADVLGGTLPYMAPELLQGFNHYGVWSDIYAFGVLLFELFTGKLPFDANRDESLVRMHLHQPPPDPRRLRPQLPASVADLVLTCLTKKLEDRYQRFDQVEQVLQQIRREQFGAALDPWWETGDEAERTQWTELGQAHMDLGEYKEALGCFRRAVTLAPERAEMWQHQARAQLRLWLYTDAQRSVDSGLGVAQDRNEYGPLYQLRGEIFAAMQNPRDAVIAYDKGLSFTPNAPGLWREKGALLLKLGLFADAKQCLDQAIKYDQFDSDAYRIRADTLVGSSKGNLKHAERDYLEAIQLAPRSAVGWARLGSCQLRLEKLRDAQTAFRMALRLDPNLQEAMDGSRRVLELLQH